MELNTQPREKMDLDKTGLVDVHSIWLTIQGEGPWVGMPAVFVRLAGCNLQCPMCDTDYTSQRKCMTPQQVAEKIERIRWGAKLVVITGGEPFRQNVGPLTILLLQLGYSVQIETNGTLYRDDLPYNWAGFMVVCSPKTSKISTQLLPYISAYKYVVKADQVDPEDGLPLSALGMSSPPARPVYSSPSGMVVPRTLLNHLANETIYVQPLDEQDEEKNKRNLATAVESCKKFGYRLCIQVHKLVNEA